ncbi:MAG: hypothetical protein K1X88_06660 [Nannocystaceae bacterium]|nr:hypothetical protein [Nannocystaceae bacterium]
MIAALVLALVLGPPKLPPLPGRAMPAPPPSEAPSPPPPSEPAPSEPAPSEPAPSEPAPSEAPSSEAPSEPAPREPAPPPPGAPTAPPPAPSKRAPPPPAAGASPRAPTTATPTEPPPPGPEIEADGPAGFQKPSPRRLPKAGAGAGAEAAPLRLVSREEVETWRREDQAAPPQPPRTNPRTPTKAIVRTATPTVDDARPEYRRPPHPPKRSAAFVVGYRYFGIRDRLGRAQDWHLASLEVTPLRRYVRVNLLTEFGIEGGRAAARGDRADLLLMERLGLGMQYPGVVTPMLEFQGGVGGARVELFGRNDLALLYTLGLDLGAQFAVAPWMWIHASLGWIRPTFVWQQKVASYDRVAFKLGVGF